MMIPLSFTSTSVFAVPRSIPISLEKNPIIWSKIIILPFYALILLFFTKIGFSLPLTTSLVITTS